MPEIKTLEDVRALLKDQNELTVSKRNELRSAVNTLAKTLGKRPEELPASSSDLSMQLHRAQPGALGISRDRWNNVASLVRKALELVGAQSRPLRSDALESPAWAALRSRGPTPESRIGVSAFARWCSEHKIEPSDVSADVFERFRAEREADTLDKRAKPKLRRIAKAWNRLAAALPEERLEPVELPTYRRVSYVRRWNEFPPELEAEINAYLEARGAGRLKLPNKRHNKRTWISQRPRENTRTKTKYLLRQFASAAVARGIHPRNLRQLSDLLTPAVLEAAFNHLTAPPREMASSENHNIFSAVSVVAQLSFKISEQAMDDLRAKQELVHKPYKEMVQRNRIKLKPLLTPESRQQLLQLCERLVRIARGNSTSQIEGARLFRDALIVEMALRTGLRRYNLCRLRDDQLTRIPCGKGKEQVYLAIHDGEIKNTQDYERELSPRLVSLLDEYRDRYRPLLSKDHGGFLFPGAKPGKSLSVDYLGHRFALIVDRHLGLKMNIHLVRHFLGAVILEKAENPYALGPVVLNHRNPHTFARSYAYRDRERSYRLMDRLLDEERTRTGVNRKRARLRERYSRGRR